MKIGMVRQKRTDGRIAFENIPSPIRPSGSFEIEVVDEQGNPLKGLKFNISVDGDSEKTVETNDAGILKTRKPRTELSVKQIDA
jgi:hypothetical protein